MLNQLINLLATKENGLSLAEIGRKMKSQPTAVKAMIDLLVKKGKILEVGPDGKYCEACGLQSDCNLLKARGKRYVILHALESDGSLAVQMPSTIANGIPVKTQGSSSAS